MNILVTGQCSIHWGRMEFGNIGNYYIIEPFFRELHRVFPGSTIRTTLQMSEAFCSVARVEVLPLDLYYGWRPNELELAKKELALSEVLKSTGRLTSSTPYLDAVQWSDIVIDFSGDIWGDNATLLGKDRFEVGLVKNLVAKNLGKPLAMLAGSPGPFTEKHTRDMARHVFSQFDLVTNREPISTRLLQEQGFDTSKTLTLACPAFLFEPARGAYINALLEKSGLAREGRIKPVVGFVICGWNFTTGPFDRWPRDDSDYFEFAQLVEYLSKELGARVCLLSHSNGFDMPPAPFKLKRGRDYAVIKQLQRVVASRGIAPDVFALDGIYDPWQTKAIIGSFDMLISGRVHAAVAALSQLVPTVVIDYGHEPKAHKLLGFATVAGAANFVACPSNLADLKRKIVSCWKSRAEYRALLEKTIPKVQDQARENFRKLKEIV